MRADRLVSMVLLLRQRGRMTAESLARELEVSTRTVLRDVEALSTAGVPVYAERGRHGGFALLPGFHADLAGLTRLNEEEALALATAGAARGGQVLGLGPALGSAVRKVVDALPEAHRTTAGEVAQRFLVEPEADLLSRRRPTEDVSPTAVAEVRRAVLAGRRLRLEYTPDGGSSGWRTVDPVGLVAVRDRTYLLALRAGEDRTYRLSRVTAAEALAEPARRPPRVDLERLWRDRCAAFLADDVLLVPVRVAPARREELVATALAVRAEEPGPDGWPRLDVAFQDLRHAVWAVWQLGADAEALGPPTVRAALAERAATLAARYAER